MYNLVVVRLFGIWVAHITIRYMYWQYKYEFVRTLLPTTYLFLLSFSHGQIGMSQGVVYYIFFILHFIFLSLHIQLSC